MAAVIEILFTGQDQVTGASQSVAAGLRGVGEAASASGGQTESFFGRLFSNATNILSSINLVKGFAQGIAGVATSMISGNAEFERYETQFGVLLGSAGAAKDRLAELAQFGATTPFELPELVQADKVLTSFGLDSADTAARFHVSAQQIRTTIGDVAAGTGVKFEELALTFGKFASGATGEAVARFQELGIATKEQMASWGLEFSKSGQLLTPAREAFTVLEAHVREKFGGMMAAQSQTFEGMVSNLQDWWGSTKRTLAEPIFEVFKTQLAGALQVLGSPAVMGAIQGFAQGLAQGIGGAITFLTTTAIPALIRGWQAIQPAIQAVLNVVASFEAALRQVSASVDTNGRAMSDTFRTVFATIQATVQTALNAVMNVVGSVLGVVRSLIQNHGAQMLSAFQSTFSSIVSTVSQYSQAFYSVVSAVLGQVASFINANQGQIASTFASIWTQIGGIVRTAMAIIQATIIPALQAIASFIQAHGAQIQTILGGAWQVISSLIQGALAIIQGVLKAVLAVIQGDWAGAWNAIREMSASVVQALIGIVTGLLNIIAGLFGTSLDRLAAMWSDNWNNKIPAILHAALQGLLSLVQTALSQFIAYWFNLPPQVVQALGNAGQLLLNVGRQLVDGLQQGVADQWNAFIGWIHDKMMQLPEPVRQALGISSPSKVFMEIGKAMMDGLIEGLDQMGPDVDRKMLQVFGNALSDMMDALGHAVDAFQKISGFTAPALATLQDLIRWMDVTMAEFVEVGRRWHLGAMEAVQRFSDATNKIFDSISKALGVFRDMRDVSAISQSQVETFSYNMELILSHLIGIDFAWQNFLTVWAEGSYLDAIGSVFDAIVKGADAFSKLQGISQVQIADVRMFGQDIAVLVTNLAYIADQLDVDGVMAAAAFANAAGQCLSIIETGVNAFAALATFRDVPLTQIRSFRDAMVGFVAQLAQAVSQVSSEALTHAAEFAKAAGQIVGIIGDGVAGFGALQGFVLPANTAMMHFTFTVLSMVEWMDQAAKVVSTNGVAMGAAITFADGAGKIIGILGAGVDGFKALNLMAAPTTTAMMHFTYTLLSMIEWMDQAAKVVASNSIGMAAATAFAEGAGKVIGILKSGVEGLLAVAGFSGQVPTTAMMNFANALRQMVALIAQVAVTFQVQAIQAAANFADAAGKVIGLLKDGVEALGKVVDYKVVPEGPLQTFVGDVRRVFNAVVTVAGLFDGVTVARAVGFAEATGTIVGAIKSAIEVFGKLEDFKATAPEILANFIAAIKALVVQFVQIALPAAGAIGDAIVAGIASAIAAKGYQITNALLMAVQDAVKAAKTALGIQSPSRLFAQEIGRPIAAGIAQGIHGGAPLVGAAVQQITQPGSITNNYYSLNYGSNQPSTGSAAADIRLLGLMQATGAF